MLLKFNLVEVEERRSLFFSKSYSLRASLCNIFNLYINDLDKMNKLNKSITQW